MSRCKSCGADIRWATTNNGRNIPLDVEPDPAGNVWVDDDGTAVILGRGIKPPRGVDESEDLYFAHFATCPDADKFRR